MRGHNDVAGSGGLMGGFTTHALEMLYPGTIERPELPSRRHAARKPPVASVTGDRLALRDRPDLNIVRRPDGAMFLLRDRPCEIHLREVTVRVGNSGTGVDDPGPWSCGDRVQRDLVTALLFERPDRLRVSELAPDRLRIYRQLGSSGHAFNTAVWDTVTLEIVWDLARARVDLDLRRLVDTST